MFVDHAKIWVQAGKGGNGIVAFRREKYIPKGGPAGGSGGRGGSIIFQADSGLTTLLDFRYQQHYKGDPGEPGGGSHKHGKDGSDLRIKVPVGAVVYEEGVSAPIADLVEPGQEFVLAKGGRGGRGNAVFANSTRQAPRFAENGEPGEEKRILLELKLLADVGLVGYPNVGKSTLVSACSAARPKIADYPFTTLVPNLGMVRVDEKSFVMADIPGLIEGAHEGLGLGHQFLRHIERTRVILHVLDVSGTTGRDPLDDYRIIRHELAAYNERLSSLPQLIVLNKTDVTVADEIANDVEAALSRDGLTVHRISAVTRQGLDPLLYAAVELLEQHPAPPTLHEPVDMTVFTYNEQNDRKVEVHREADGAYRIEGAGIERRVAMTDMQNEEGVRRLHRQLVKLGIEQALRAAGIEEGDTVRVGDLELDFADDNAEWVK